MNFLRAYSDHRFFKRLTGNGILWTLFFSLQLTGFTQANDSSSCQTHTAHRQNMEWVTLSCDYNNDGLFDFITQKEFNGNGDLIRQHVREDDDCDGFFDRYYVETYNASGFLEKFESDNDGNGNFDEVYTYLIDKNGEIMKEIMEDLNEHIIAILTYDAEQHLIGVSINGVPY